MVRQALQAAVICFGLIAISAARAATVTCPDSPRQTLVLPRLRQAFTDNRPLVIVAIGSSSTQGAMSSDAAHTYPAILQTALTAALPGSHIAVINRGIGGQDAPEELPRLQTDALAIRPQLVVWQVGANGALREIQPPKFRQLINDGINQLQAAKVDIVLMDNQRSPAILAHPDHDAMDKALADIAHERNVSLFSRGALMDNWQNAGTPYSDFISPDGLHQNDRGYFCTARAFAASIEAAITAPPR